MTQTNLKFPRVGALAVGAALVACLAACNAAPPELTCTVARAGFGGTGSFASVYTLKAGEDPTTACARKLTAEAIGLQKYFSEDPAAPDTIALRSATLGGLPKALAPVANPAPTFVPNAVGALASESPGEDNFCSVPELSVARLDIPAVDSASQAPQSFVYAWSNLRIYNTPGIPGTQFVADLRYTENGCTANYQVKGIWPVVACKSEVDCDPNPDFAAGRTFGSGINPLFPVTCHPTAKLCVLTGDVPSPEK
jgi:hypothetical protein